MKKQALTKIIGIIFVFVFVISIFQPILSAQAVTDNIADTYSNPNQDNGKNPYKFKISDVVNSNLLTQVVGCTGIVNKVSTWMVGFIQSPVQQAKILKDKIEKYKETAKAACAATKGAVQTTLGSIPSASNTVEGPTTLAEKIKACAASVDAMNDKQVRAIIEQNEKDAERDLKNSCLDGIAITLAKNQLTSMTRSAMNWVNSGYGGDPFFVQSMTNFTNNLENNVLNTGIDILLSPNGSTQNPYAQNFIRSSINSNNLYSSSSDFLSGLSSDLSNFITSPTSYFTDDQMDDAAKTQQALQQAQEANDIFAHDFSAGGWDGWLALTQTPQNNPLGYSILASQNIANEQAKQVAEKSAELTQNNGFLSQKVCVKWQVYEENGKPKKSSFGVLPTYSYDINGNRITIPGQPTSVFQNTKPDPCYAESGDCCASEADGGWKTITPGSIIKEKTTNYLNSPERQLELAKTINDSLNALFSILISKLEDSGLSGLSDSANNNSNWTDNLNTYTSSDGNSTYDNNGAYDGFNITRDLGNNYIYENTEELGTWNAKTNETKLTKEIKITKPDGSIVTRNINSINGGLYPGLAPEVSTGDSPANKYYTVDNNGTGIVGYTKLINEGYNGWANGDRAFWDGEKWQNWKKGQLNPIKKRGVIQIQQDFIVAAKEITGVLPTVMSKLGELDYCIPGPNPNYQTNSNNAQSAYQSWIGSMYVGPRDEKRTEWKIDHEESSSYQELADIFTDNPKTWQSILKPDTNVGYTFLPMWLLDNFDRSWIYAPYNNSVCDPSNGGEHGGCCVANHRDTQSNWVEGRISKNCLNYHYDGDSNFSGYELQDINERKKMMSTWQDYINNNLFQNFYNTFDKMMNAMYFKNMTSKYLEKENVSTLTPNPAYIEMAESGLSFTKNILYYGEDTTRALDDYTTAIEVAQANIAKLNPIKTEISGIIKAAQDRRDANLVAQINREGGTEKIRTPICQSYLASCGTSAECNTTYNECMAANGRDLTITLYKKLYASCLDEENISFYDPDEITALGNVDEERCSDGIDNDYDRLVDEKDPDCKTPTTRRPSVLVNNLENTYALCSDGQDNDEDGYIDDKDLDCDMPENTLQRCWDDLDNDQDGYIDNYPNGKGDPECVQFANTYY